MATALPALPLSKPLVCCDAVVWTLARDAHPANRRDASVVVALTVRDVRSASRRDVQPSNIDAMEVFAMTPE